MARITIQDGKVVLRDGKIGTESECCCGPNDPCCVTGQLPDTVTVTLSGPQGTKEQGPSLLSLRFAACFGSGAEGIAIAPGGDDPEEDGGPISDAPLTNGGSGYAKLGRVAPTLTITGGSGEGATFTPTLESVNDDCGVPTWRISSVTATGGAGGYQNLDSLSATAATGQFEVTAADLLLEVTKSEPVVEASVSTGTGAELAVFLVFNNTTGGYSVHYVEVIQPGTDYEDQEAVVFSVTGDGIEAQQAQATITTNEDGEILFVTVDFFATGEYYIENKSVFVRNGGKYYAEDASISPYVASVEVSVLQGWPGSGGSGATITATVDSDTASETFGRITSLTVTSGGSNYFGWKWIYSCDCDWVYGEDPPQDHTVVAWRDLAFFPESRFGGPCVFVAPRCYGNPSYRNTGPYYLVRAVVSSEFGVFYALVEGAVGKPGRDNGPIISVGWPVDYTEHLQVFFAYPGRVQDGPSIIDGTDVAITASMEERFDSEILPYWTVTGVSVPPGVEGFTNGQPLELFSTTQEPLLPLRGFPQEDLGRTPATGLAVVDEDGVLVGVTVTNGGKFYNETSESVITANIEVAVEQYLPSQGSGAEITATIETDLNSNNFGRVTLAVANAGDGYLGGYYGEDFVAVAYPGPNDPPTVNASRDISPLSSAFLLCNTTLTADEPIADCSKFSFEATFGDQTATVEPGGEVAPPFEGSNKCCHKCFVCCPESPSQVVATFTRAANEGYALRAEDNELELNDSLYSILNGIGYTSPGFSNFKNFAPQGAYYTTCPSHEVEVVWDVADLHAENRCSVDVCEELPEEASCFTTASIDEETALFFGYYSDNGFAFYPSIVPDDQNYSEGLPTYYGGERVLGSPEVMLLTVEFVFIDSGYNLDPHSCPVRVIATSSSIVGGASSNGGGNKTLTYTKPSDLSCGSVPGQWDFSEEGSSSSDIDEVAAYAGVVPLSSFNGEPGDLYRFNIGTFNIGTSTNGIARRICNNYAVSVEFQ